MLVSPLQDLGSDIILTFSGEKTPEGVHTPLPGTPFAWNQAQAPLIMTPDTPYFEMSSGVFGGNQENEKVRDNIELEWTESEDEMLSSVSTALTAPHSCTDFAVPIATCIYTIIPTWYTPTI